MGTKKKRYSFKEVDSIVFDLIISQEFILNDEACNVFSDARWSMKHGCCSGCEAISRINSYLGEVRY